MHVICRAYIYTYTRNGPISLSLSLSLSLCACVYVHVSYLNSNFVSRNPSRSRIRPSYSPNGRQRSRRRSCPSKKCNDADDNDNNDTHIFCSSQFPYCSIVSLIHPNTHTHTHTHTSKGENSKQACDQESTHARTYVRTLLLLPYHSISPRTIPSSPNSERARRKWQAVPRATVVRSLGVRGRRRRS